jgi:ketosteroid isomerase-like protein
MSQENVEIVRKMMTAFIDGDYERALLAFDSEVEGDFTHMPDGRMTLGREELRGEIAGWQGTWDEFETEVEDIIDAEGERVVLLVRQTGTGRGSGVKAEIRYAQIFVVRDGAVASMKTYLDPDEAWRDAGLSK